MQGKSLKVKSLALFQGANSYRSSLCYSLRYASN
jgi:hypothetical protein